MTRRRRALVAAIFIAPAIALVAWLRSRDEVGDASGRAHGPDAARSADAKATAKPYDGGRIEQTIADRAVRDDLRRRILAAWAAEGAPAKTAAEGAPADTAARPAREQLLPMPERDGGVDPSYIQSVMRADMFPMARGCFEDLLARQPDAGGRVEMFFKIVADEHLGGVVDEVEIDAGAPDAIRDDKMNTCVRESLMSLAFRPPPHGGIVTIGYPIVFSAAESED